MFTKIINSPSFLRLVSGVLRTFFPVLHIGKWVIISRFEDVKEVLSRDRDFTIAEINTSTMHALELDFFLGMDASEIHDLEKSIMESIAKREDLELIQQISLTETTALIAKVLTNRKIELVHDLSRIIPLVLIEKYFGIEIQNKTKMQEWMRKLFYQLFLNLTNDEQVATEARQAATEMKTYMVGIICEAHKKFDAGILAPNTLLYRLLTLQKTNSNVTDEFIRKNLSGLMIGAVDTTSKCVVLIIQELLSRSNVMEEAKNAGIQKLKNICYEALRFNPHNPIVVRFSKSENRIGNRAQHRIKANRKMAIGIFSAMQDGRAFTQPQQFNSERTNEYLHFGFGLHVCFGRHINAVQIPAIVGNVVRLKNIRQSGINQGKILYDGPFPNEFWLEFD